MSSKNTLVVAPKGTQIKEQCKNTYGLRTRAKMGYRAAFLEISISSEIESE